MMVTLDPEAYLVKRAQEDCSDPRDLLGCKDLPAFEEWMDHMAPKAAWDRRENLDHQASKVAMELREHLDLRERWDLQDTRDQLENPACLESQELTDHLVIQGKKVHQVPKATRVRLVLRVQLAILAHVV